LTGPRTWRTLALFGIASVGAWRWRPEGRRHGRTDAATKAARIPPSRSEIRIALVCYGGVSPAIDLAARDWVRARVVVDMISGTSTGGINGVFRVLASNGSRRRIPRASTPLGILMGSSSPNSLQHSLPLDHDDRTLHDRPPAGRAALAARLRRRLAAHRCPSRGGFDQPRLPNQGGSYAANAAISLPAIKADVHTLRT
jgi:hypothetical protein